MKHCNCKEYFHFVQCTPLLHILYLNIRQVPEHFMSVASMLIETGGLPQHFLLFNYMYFPCFYYSIVFANYIFKLSCNRQTMTKKTAYTTIHKELSNHTFLKSVNIRCYISTKTMKHHPRPPTKNIVICML